MNKSLDVCGLGNGLVDIFVEASEGEFSALDFEKGTMRLVESAEQRELLRRFADRSPVMASGGSVANSIIAHSQLGGRAGFIGSFGADEYGAFYRREFDDLGIRLNRHVTTSLDTGTVVALITPDAERTMRTHLGAAAAITPAHVDEELIRDSRWLFVEGYLFSNPGYGQPTVRHAVELAKRHDTKIAVTCSEAWVVSGFGEALRAAVASAELFFTNESEAMAFTGRSSAESAFDALCETIPGVVVTRGGDGALVKFGEVKGAVSAFPCNPRDLTGAGDMFAGAFLYGVTHGVGVLDSARAACYLAMHVVTRVGARLHQGARGYWDDCMSGRV
jgi:sugar/nucleoside kinase (ribokinase family)